MSLFFVLATPASFDVNSASAHGSHAKFLSPEKGAFVAKELTVHIEATQHPFPYVFIRIKPHFRHLANKEEIAAAEQEKWSGLLPLQEDGYRQVIDTSGWKAGDYVVEAQFLGDVVEHVQKRVFVVK